MSLALLVATPAVCAYYDAAADVLFVDVLGHGPLTGRQAQVVRGRVGQVARSRPYPRVLLRTQPSGGLTPQSPHLGQLLGADLPQLGVRHLAWVCQPALASLAAAPGWLPERSVVVNLFNDVEQAATWLGKYGDPASLGEAPLPTAYPTAGRRPAALSRGPRVPPRVSREQPPTGLLAPASAPAAQ